MEYTDKSLGPIVRISPNEVHCSDSQFIDEIYPLGSRERDKPLHQVRGSGTYVMLIFSCLSVSTFWDQPY
jgi:hypothetical protein